MKVKQVPCTDCGRNFRPSNLARHRKARHLPKAKSTPYGTKFEAPPEPVQQKKHDRRYDEAYPRGVGPYRYRIYRLRAGELELIAAAPDAAGLGIGVVRLYEEGEFITDDSVGLLDTAEDPGKWVVNPWNLGRRPAE
jgi:hypothetical protein